MAEDKKIAIEVEVKGTEESLKTVKDLKAAIKSLQEEVENSDIGSEQYKNAVEELDKLNNKLKQVTQTEEQYAKSLEDTAKAEKEAIKETQDLRKQFEILEDELFLLAGQGKQNTKEFKELTIQAAALNEKIDEVNSTLGGGGADRAAMGYAKLNEGLRNLDFKSVKEGMSAIKTALASTGILLLVQGVTYLYENFDELSKGSGLLAKALRFVGDIITSVKDAVLSFTDSIGITNSALDKMGDATVENANKAKEALAGQTAEYDRQISIAKASGKSAVDLEIAKQQAIIETNKALVQQTIAYVKQGGVLNEEQNKLLTEQLNAIKNAATQQNVITLTAEKEKNDKLKAANDEQLANHKKLLEDKAKADLDAWNKSVEIRIANKAAQDADDKRIADEKKAQDELDRQEQLDAITESNSEEQAILMSDSEFKRKLRKLELEEFKTNYNAQLSTAQSLTSSLQSLSDSYFYFKTKNLQKGSAEELKQAKKQFDINKGIAIANATISGIQGVVNALSAQSVIPEPFGAILKGVTAVAVGAAAVANISKIASQKFNPGGGGGGGGGGVAAVAVPSPPTINTPSANTNSSTSFDETGKKVGGEKEPIKPTINVNSTVSVKEINDKQNDVKVLEEQSTFK